MRRLTLLALSLTTLLAACASVPEKPAPLRLAVDVTSLTAGGADLMGPHRFGLAAPGGEEPLVDQSLAENFGERLAALKNTREDEDPDWWLQVSHTVTAIEDQVPEKRKHERYYDPGEARIVTRYHRGVPTQTVIEPQGRWRDRTYVTPASSKAAYNVKVVVRLYGAASAPPLTPNALPLWEGSLIVHQSSPDPLRYAPAYLHELAREFPHPSGAPEQRKILAEP